MGYVFSKQNRALLAELVRTDFKLRYQGSFIGYGWSLLRPLFIFVILYVVFVRFLKLGSGIPHYPVYLLLGIVLWNFFVDMTMQSLGSIVGRGDLIRKIRIPRWIIVLSSSISAVINLILNLVVISIFMVVSHVSLMSSVVWVPFLLFEIYVLAFGLSLFFSAAFVEYRDLNYIWEVCVQAGFYATPILYPLSRITNTTLQKFILLNPMAQAIQDIRYCLITHETVIPQIVVRQVWLQLIPFTAVVVIFIGGLLYFRAKAKYFAENI